jgi:hypothetical protein
MSAAVGLRAHVPFCPGKEQARQNLKRGGLYLPSCCDF